MRVAVFSLFASVACAGCYASNVVDGAEMGTRLVPNIFEDESGDAIFGGWYDPMLGSICDFRRGEGGRVRCEPRAEVMYGEAFLDEGCTERAYAMPEGCALPPLVASVHFGPICGAEDSPRLTYYRIGERLSETRVFRTTPDGSCVAETSSAALHRLVALDLDTLVEAEVEEGTGARLVRDRLLAADGSRQHFALRDTLRGEACTVRGWINYGAALERVPCVPTSAASVTRGGASCDERWASRPVGWECLPSPDVAYAETLTSSCLTVTDIEVFLTSGPIEESARVFGDACDGVEHAELFAIAPAPEGTVPWLTRTMTGEGRVRRVEWAAGDVSVGAHFYDTELGLPCRPTFTMDGELRCLPDVAASSVGAPRLFLDEACTRPGARLDECDRRWLIELAPPSGSCARELGIAAVHRLGGAFGRGYRLDATGACIPAEDDEIVHELERVPVTDFPLIESSAP